MGLATLAEASRARLCHHDYSAGRGASILRIHLWAPSFTGFGGGIGAFSRELAKGLRELGHELRLFGRNDREAGWDGFNVSGAGPFGSPFRKAGFVVSNLMAIGTERPDHVISTHVNFGPLAQLAKKIFGMPYTLVAHGIDIHLALPDATLAALRDADRIIAVSSWTRDRVLDLGGIEPRNVVVLHNSIDEKAFTLGPRPEYLSKRYGLRPSERVVLTVARLDPRERYKGYDRIIEAMPAVERECGPVRFLLVGQGGDRARVAALARKRGLESAVSFAGFVPSEELVDHYRPADVFAMPSTGEGFGVVFLEAMACGTPVIAGNRDGSCDALDLGRLGCLVDPNNIDSISASICSLLRGEGESWWFDRQALREAALRHFGHAEFVKHLRAGLPF